MLETLFVIVLRVPIYYAYVYYIHMLIYHIDPCRMGCSCDAQPMDDNYHEYLDVS